MYTVPYKLIWQNASAISDDSTRNNRIKHSTGNVNWDAASESNGRSSVKSVADVINGYGAHLNYFGDAAGVD